MRTNLLFILVIALLLTKVARADDRLESKIIEKLEQIHQDLMRIDNRLPHFGRH